MTGVFLLFGMSDKLDCKKLWEELNQLKELRGEFARVYAEELIKRDFSECRQFFYQMRDILKGPDSEIGKLREMKDAPELKHLKLKEQYESQVEVAWKSGLFGDRVEAVKSDVPVIERGGKKYSMPNWQEVQKTLRKLENLEIIKEKSAQGFTKMLIVPFGYDLKTMAGKFKDKVRELDRAGLNPDGSSNPNKGIFGSGGEKVEFNRSEADYPVAIWEVFDENQLVYYPKQYDKDNHGGLSKEDAIKINGAWQICFVEDMPVIPLEADEKKDVIGGRKRIDRKGSCIKGQTEIPELQQFHAAMQDKEKMENLTKYNHEKGQTPEQYLWMQLTSLLENEKPVLMDYENGVWTGTYLTENYNIVLRSVLFAGWAQHIRRIYLDWYDPDDQDDDCGVRPSVNIKK